uniref:Uncharacterized protein n=1 Tax=Arundo donax TaxID=35708 RepID=A0A0A9BG69_ARUDO
MATPFALGPGDGNGAEPQNHRSEDGEGPQGAHRLSRRRSTRRMPRHERQTTRLKMEQAIDLG